MTVTTVFVDTRLSKTKHPRKRFQNIRQSYMLSTDRIEIHQSQPASMTKRRCEGHTSGCDWWISIRSVDNTLDWRKFWKRFRGCFPGCFPLCQTDRSEIIPNILVRRERNGPLHLNSDRNFRNLWHNGKHPQSRVSTKTVVTHFTRIT